MLGVPSILKRTLLILFACLVLVPATSMAQNKKLKNQPTYDKKPLHFGFCLGLNFYDFQIQPIEDLAANPDVFRMWSETSPGYSIGIVSNLRLTNHFDLRFIPTFSATVRTLYFDMINPLTSERSIEEYEVESSFVQFPFELKFKSERINNHRWYVLAGIQYNIDLASKEKVEDDTIFKIKRNNAAYEFGVGIDIYFEYFKFSPQLKAAFGMNNLLVEDGTVPVSGIDEIRSRCILLNFTFE